MWSLDCSQPRPASAMMSKAMALSRSRGRIHLQRSQARPQRSISTVTAAGEEHTGIGRRRKVARKRGQGDKREEVAGARRPGPT